MSSLRSRTLIAAVVTTILVALLAGMALAAGGGGGGTAGASGYGYGGGWDPCADLVCRWAASGRVAEQGAGTVLADATVTLQRRAPGGDWAAVPADELRPRQNPLRTDAAGRFTWLVPGNVGDEVRVTVARDGYAPGTSAVRTLRADGALDVELAKLPAPPAPAGGQGPPAPSSAAPVVTGAATPARPAPAPAVKAVGCAAKKGPARSACLRAEKLTRALKACRTQKGAKRRTCERRARALSACETKRTGKQRSACRRKAQAIGRHAKPRR